MREVWHSNMCCEVQLAVDMEPPVDVKAAFGLKKRLGARRQALVVVSLGVGLAILGY